MFADHPDRRITVRSDLEVVAREHGASAELAARLARDAAWGIRLEAGGQGVSRLGGSPVLPLGAQWPVGEEGRPLTHLATIDLTELPDVEGRELLPSDGTLAFFADLSEEGEFYEPVGPEGEDRDIVAIIHTPAGRPTSEPDAPKDTEVLTERRVRLIERLQIPEPGFHGGGEDQEIVNTIYALVNGPWLAAHQMLGNPPVAQEDPREHGEIVLLHMSDDDALGFGFLDLGTITAYAPADDLRAGRWDRLTWWPSSC